MGEYEQTMTMRASPEQVLDFVADIGNMPSYLPTTKSAQPQGADRVRVQGEAMGHKYDSDGYLRRDAGANRLEWGADEGYYSGWLEARDGGDGGAQVTVHISLRGAPPGAEVQLARVVDGARRPVDVPPREGVVHAPAQRGLLDERRVVAMVALNLFTAAVTGTAIFAILKIAFGAN